MVSDNAQPSSPRPPSSPSVTIDLGGVSPARNPLPEVAALEAVEQRTRPDDLIMEPENVVEPVSEKPGRPTRPTTTTIEACSARTSLVASKMHPVVAAAHCSFARHYPLVLSPDIIWMLIAQGFAEHVNVKAETLRPLLVQHAGQVAIRVRRDDFRKGSPDNPWPEVFDEFALQIRDHLLPPINDLLTPNFSTTGPTERAAAQVVLLDAMQPYFYYDFWSRCGIPEVILEGTPHDWENVATRVKEFEGFGLKWWTDHLAPILQEFVDASEGRPNKDFWRALYKVVDRSGGPYISGWIIAFFPYLREYRGRTPRPKNPWLQPSESTARQVLFPLPSEETSYGPHGPTTASFPSGLSLAPFTWHYLESEFSMDFLGGFLGIRQEPDTLRLRPEIGWAVREKAEESRPSSARTETTRAQPKERPRPSATRSPSLAGTWHGHLEQDRHRRQLTVTLIQDGTQISGKVHHQAPAQPITLQEYAERDGWHSSDQESLDKWFRARVPSVPQGKPTFHLIPPDHSPTDGQTKWQFVNFTTTVRRTIKSQIGPWQHSEPASPELVEYSGTLSDDGNTIQGTWESHERHQEPASGTFLLRRSEAPHRP